MYTHSHTPSAPQVPIVESGALKELSKLVGQEGFHEIQCHAAGTLRNLAAENQNQVCVVMTSFFLNSRRTWLALLYLYWNRPFFPLQAIVEAGCLIALSEQLRDSANVPETVLSEVSAAMAVLASDGESICYSVALSSPRYSCSNVFMSHSIGKETDNGAVQRQLLQDPHQTDQLLAHRGPVQLCRGHRSPGHQS